MLRIILAFALSLPALTALAGQVTFPSNDGLKITADYEEASNGTTIVLFHQAGSSRGEYKTIAPRLNKLGYNTLSVDLRSGDAFAGVKNETAARGATAGKGSSFLDAKPDMLAAITYATTRSATKKVVIWGSSYSAALSLVIAGEGKANISGALAFSPGEYLPGVSVEKAASTIAIPTYMSSARSEVRQWQPFLKAVSNVQAVGFKPQGDGRHGSSALIKGRSSNASEYWQSVEAFLKKHF
ncbi:MAG: dienelactone hydrolase family protein [Hyphomicrobiales bacterium]